MKQKTLRGLLYKELYMGKKPLIASFASAFVLAGLCLLVLNSFEHGNLRLLEDSARNVMWDFSLIACQYLPVLMLCFASEVVAEISVKEEDSRWARFRLTTPVRPIRFATARFALMVGMNFIAIVLSIGYLALVSVLFDVRFTVGKVGIVWLCATATGLFSVSMQIMVLLFRNLDKAGMAMMGFLVVLLVILRGINEANPEIFGIHKIHNLSDMEQLAGQRYPIFIVLFLVIFLCGFVVTTCLYRRREK
ncbi:MAG: hypothetical protein ACI4EK_03765 [Wujia sp.]